MTGRFPFVSLVVRSSAIALVAGLCAAPPLWAQARGGARRAPTPPASTTIEGDVYLTMQSGDIRKQAGGRVYLLSERAASESPALRAACMAKVEASARIARIRAQVDAFRDSAYKLPAGVDRQRYLDAASRADSAVPAMLAAGTANVQLPPAAAAAALLSAPTGMESHYRLAPVPPGRYYLYSHAQVYNRSYAWGVPVTVASEALRVDLDNENVVDPGEYGTIADALAQTVCKGS